MSFTYHPTTFLDAEESVFKNVKVTTPMKTITYRDWVFSTVKDLRYEVEKIRAVFNSDLSIDSQNIKINAGVSLIGYPMRSAFMEVDKKDGRTRITVTNFSMGDVSSVGGTVVGGVFIGGSDTEYYEMDNVTWNERKQSFKRAFIKNYSKKLEKSIIQAVQRLRDSNDSENDDW